MSNVKTIWFDITNTPQVHFLLAVKNMFKEDEYKDLITCRHFSETVDLLKQRVGNDFNIIGDHKGKNRIHKVLGIVGRMNQIHQNKFNYDLSISCGSESAIWYSALKGKKSIAFGDNDLAKQWTYSRFVDYSFFPKAIDAEVLHNQGIKSIKLYQYDGYKENIYIADYIPDKNFYSKLRFKDYILIRAENLQANYIKKNNVKSIVPQLIKLFTARGLNIVFLPRYKSDKDLVEMNDNVFIPPEPLNGLDLVYYAEAVLTGAGTLAREAACLGTPSVSFFAGDNLLAVDKELIEKKKMFYSRDPADIADYLLKSKKNEPDFSDSKRVQEEVKEKLNQVLSSFGL